jgi:outer membrane protein assembly factor BamB
MDNPVNPAVSPQTALPQTMDATRSPVFSQGIPSIPSSERETWLPSARNKGISGRTLAITLLCCVLLVSLTGGGAWTYIKQQQLLNYQHATATVRAAPFATATATAAVTAYNTAIAANGIQFGFNAQHTRYNPYERILSPSNVKRLTRAWTAETGGFVYSSPAVANGVVYVGSSDKKLSAFKADGCGQVRCGALWTAETGGSVYSSPAVANGVVYVGSFDKKLYAFHL